MAVTLHMTLLLEISIAFIDSVVKYLLFTAICSNKGLIILFKIIHVT
jgi:hypothetical protein